LGLGFRSESGSESIRGTPQTRDVGDSCRMAHGTEWTNARHKKRLNSIIAACLRWGRMSFSLGNKPFDAMLLKGGPKTCFDLACAFVGLLGDRPYPWVEEGGSVARGPSILRWSGGHKPAIPRPVLASRSGHLATRSVIFMVGLYYFFADGNPLSTWYGSRRGGRGLFQREFTKARDGRPVARRGFLKNVVCRVWTNTAAKAILPIGSIFISIVFWHRRPPANSRAKAQGPARMKTAVGLGTFVFQLWLCAPRRQWGLTSPGALRPDGGRRSWERLWTKSLPPLASGAHGQVQFVEQRVLHMLKAGRWKSTGIDL